MLGITFRLACGLNRLTHAVRTMAGVTVDTKGHISQIINC